MPDKVFKIVALALLALTVLAGGVAASNESDFETANGYFRDKEYGPAIDTYESIVARGVESAPLYYNLGNAYFRNGDLGRAVLNYMKARKLAPADNDIRDNLEFAKQYTNIQMEGVKLNPISSFLESLVGTYRLNTLAWVSSAIFILFMILLSLRYGLGIRNAAVRVGIVTVLIFLVIASWLTTFKYRNDYLTQRAVIIAEECPVTTGPSDESDIELEAAPGLVVEILSESGDYYNVLFENKRRGWIKKELVAEI